MAIQIVPPATARDGASNQTRRDRSFAAVYENARKAATNDNPESDRDRAQAEKNKTYIDNLHENVDTLRGELLVRVIQSSANIRDTQNVPADISRLSGRLDKLRDKLKSEEERLSGTLVDVTI